MYVGKSCDQIRPAGLHPCRSCPAGLRLKRAPEEESQLTQAVFLGGQNLFNSSLIANYFRG